MKILHVVRVNVPPTIFRPLRSEREVRTICDIRSLCDMTWQMEHPLSILKKDWSYRTQHDATFSCSQIAWLPNDVVVAV